MPESPTPTFQVAISGPAGSTFPSFRSTELGEHGFKDIKLTNIRNKANISRKLLFTADGQTSVDDNTTLAYYMSLSVEGEAILQSVRGVVNSGPAVNLGNPAAPAPAPPAVPLAAPPAVPPAAPPAVPPAAPPAVPPAVPPAAPLADAPVNPPSPPAQDLPAPRAGVQTFIVKVLDSTPGAAPAAAAVPMPDTSAVTKLLEQVSKSTFLTRGTLPTFTNTELAALKGDYAALVDSSEKKPEPAELKEDQWDAVLKNTRAFHGYYTDFAKGILVKAPRPAFRLRPAKVPGTPAAGATGSHDKYNPAIPPFYIFDNSSVRVTEINQQIQDTLVKEGFNSLAVSGSLGGGKAIPISVSAAFEDEHAWVNQEKKQTSVDTLAVVYNFPRVVIELDPECLELTPECNIDALSATDKEGVQRFKRRYGTVFTTCFTLGGFLLSTRHVTKEERSNLDQVKDETRRAAGISFMTSKVSGSFDVASASGTGEETGKGRLNQEARLTWDAHGGDTLLASNPAAWVSTVKDHRLWRLMNQQRVVDLFSLVKDINYSAYRNLTFPSPISHAGKDPIKDKELHAKIMALLRNALLDLDANAFVTKMEDYYRDGKYDAVPANEEFKVFMKANYPESGVHIDTGNKYQALKTNQRVYFALFMASKGELNLN